MKKRTLFQRSQQIPKTVWLLGLISLFMDISSEMIHGLLPVFLVSSLGASYSTVGLIEGFGEATTLFFKALSGPLSDKLQKRKPFIFVGYFFATLCKPIFALATTASPVLLARIFDRAGKGIRGTPRDALIADITPQHLRGAAFGLRQALDTIGAFIGPLLAILLMYVTYNNFRFVFWLATIPGLIAVTIILTSVHDLESSPTSRTLPQFSPLQLPMSFWFVVMIGALFQFARLSEAFLILRANDLGLKIIFSPMVLVIMNVVYSVAAYPAGKLSDKISRKKLLLFGFLTLILADLVLSFAAHLSFAFLGIILWGLHLALTQGVLAAWVADTAPNELKGTAYGFFNLASGVALLTTNFFAGWLWDKHGPETTFLFSSLISGGGLIILFFTKQTETSAKKVI